MRGRSSPLEQLATGVLEIEGGFKLRGTELWLDPPRSKPLAYVSHAHADHMVKGHRKAYVSLKTARFYQKRFKGNELVGLKYGEKCRAGKAVIELFPAGHILGSSQVLLEVEGMRVVYTGDIKVSPSFTAERIKIEPCDVLIMECTYGEPKYLFPHRDEMAAELLSFVKDCFDRGITPVVLAYSVGKAQEAVKVLGDAGITARLEKSVYEATEIYAELGVELINYRSFPPFKAAKEVIVIPPWRADLVRSVPSKRTLFLTGWALDRRKIEQVGADRVIPLSDHADFAELLVYVECVKPKRVYTVHGTAAFARFLKKQGIDATHLETSHVQPTLWGWV